LNVLIFALRDRRKDSALNGSKNSVIVTWSQLLCEYNFLLLLSPHIHLNFATFSVDL
jgi:hypothetical protein